MPDRFAGLFDQISERQASVRPDQTRSEKIWLWANDPLSSFKAWLWASAVLVLIIVSSIAFVLESIPSLCCGRYDWLWQPIEIVCIVIFSAEYAIRFVSCPWYFPADQAPTVQESVVKGEEHLAAPLKTKVPGESIRQHVVAR